METTLYRLADEYLAFARQLADLDVSDEALNNTLADAAGEMEDKAWNIGALILQFEGDVAMIRDAEQRMVSRRK